MILAHIILFLAYMIPALVFSYYKPSEENRFVGYRTRRSMKNNATWREGNMFASKIFLLMACATASVQLCSFVFLETPVSFQVSAVFLTVSSILCIPITEMHLYSVFDKDGNYRHNA